jgi:valyl-tRNA synthetase
MPYITEQIWQRVAPLTSVECTDTSIMVQPFVQYDETKRNAKAAGDIEWVKQCIVGIRNIRGEMDISPNKLLTVLAKNVSAEDQRRFNDVETVLTRLARIESFTVLAGGEEAPASATALVGEMELLIPMAGLIDKAAELARIAKAAEKIEKDRARTAGKLGNENFVSKAPPAVIEKEQAKLADMDMQLAKLAEQKATIDAL